MFWQDIVLCVRYRLINKGDDGFWQDVVLEGVPLYCALCKHLDHSADACFVTNPGFQKPQQPIGQVQDTVACDKGKMLMPNVVVQPTVDRATYVVVAEQSTTGAYSSPGSICPILIRVLVWMLDHLFLLHKIVQMLCLIRFLLCKSRMMILCWILILLFRMIRVFRGVLLFFWTHSSG